MMVVMRDDGSYEGWWVTDDGCGWWMMRLTRILMMMLMMMVTRIANLTTVQVKKYSIASTNCIYSQKYHNSHIWTWCFLKWVKCVHHCVMLSFHFFTVSISEMCSNLAFLFKCIVVSLQANSLLCSSSSRHDIETVVTFGCMPYTDRHDSRQCDCKLLPQFSKHNSATWRIWPFLCEVLDAAWKGTAEVCWESQRTPISNRSANCSVSSRAPHPHVCNGTKTCRRNLDCSLVWFNLNKCFHIF